MEKSHLLIVAQGKVAQSHNGQNAFLPSPRGMKSNVHMGLSPVISWWQRKTWALSVNMKDTFTLKDCAEEVLKSIGCNKYF